MALFRKVFPEHPDRTAETECFDLRPDVPVRPVMKNLGQAVHFETIPIDALFGGNTRAVGCWTVHPFEDPPIPAGAQGQRYRLLFDKSAPVWKNDRNRNQVFWRGRLLASWNSVGFGSAWILNSLALRLIRES